MKNLELAREAEEHFNAEGEKLLGLVKPTKSAPRRGNSRESSLDHRAIETFSEEDIVSIGDLGMVDGFGRQTARFFVHNEKQVGLDGADYSIFDKLAGNLARRRELRDVLSRRFIEDTLFEWLKGRFTKDLSDCVAVIPYVLEKASGVIGRVKISVPIAYLAIQKPFRVGNVEFEYFTRDFFDAMIEELKDVASKQPNYNEARIDVGLHRIRQKYQGAVFASIAMEAEETRAVEIAFEETDRALIMLRFFSPGAFVPDIPSYFGRLGQTELPRSHVFIFQGRFPNISESIDETRRFMWTVTSNHIKEFEVLGLRQANVLITARSRTELGDILLNSISFFTKGVATNDHHDKLVFTLVALETLLLKDSSEPLQINIGQRLAFLVEKTPENRKALLKTVREAYRLRSSYLHHGIEESDVGVLRHLQTSAWTGLRSVLMNLDKFKTRESLLDHLEGQILS